jgi:putative pyruvate formate lyase activating enzyme
MDLKNCRICPRECGVNRIEGEKGYCMTDAGFNIASICIHRGEEPVISGSNGICNIFFSGCNLRCIYCQNHEISRGACSSGIAKMQMEEVLDRVCSLLEQGINSLGFVSPSHVVPQVRAIINGLHSRGFHPVTVYNTNGYDKKETIRSLAGLIDIYLPDMKYVTSFIAAELSDAPDYPYVALKALREMYYQKGSVLQSDENGKGESGLLIRHLVLPGYSEESKKVLRTLAEELSTGVHISLMSQYHPTGNVADHPDLGRSLYREEYESVVEEMEKLGFRNGWVQDMDSNQNYRPDFSREHPFEQF